MAYSCAVAPTSSASPSPSAETAIRELTLRAFILGAILAIILGAANAYLGLYAGMTVSASIPAAVISMAVLRLLGGSTILENNVVQTIASAGEAVAAGAIFTFPALVILGHTGPLPYWDVTMLCLAGGTMGSLLVVFLRRAYIVDEHLPFPEGIACAQVLRTGADGSASAAPLAWGGIISAALKASQDILGFVPGTIAGARWIGRARWPARSTSRRRCSASATSSASASQAWSFWAAQLDGWSRFRSRARLIPNFDRWPQPTRRIRSGARKRVTSASARCWSAAS